MDKVLYIHDARATLMDQAEFIKSEIFIKRLQLKPVEKESEQIEAVDDFKAISQKIETEEIEEKSNDIKSSQIIEDERIEVGSVSWETYKAFFRFAPGGFWGIALVILVHVIINGCSIAVSLYLAFTLT
jgi:hypothetical protein